jgi:predicted aspartyl protease
MPLIDAGFIAEDGKIDNQRLLTYGPTVQVIIAPHKPPDNKENLKTKAVFALVDTGATYCMIDTRLAKELELNAVDKAFVAGVGGSKEHTFYLAGIVVPQLDIVQFGKFLAADLKDGGQEHEVLLGRDFLQHTIMIYDGLRAQVTLASVKK